MNEGYLLKRGDAGGIWPLLLMVSGYAAMERASQLVELVDLVKAIYIVDLEHVVRFWDTWEHFESFILRQKLGDGSYATFINRTLYLVRLELAIRENEDVITILGTVSQQLQESVTLARKYASDRAGTGATPTTCDLLLSVCSVDCNLAATLQQAGLKLEDLKNWVARS